MFTGLIEDVGELIGRHPEGNAGKLEIRTALPLEEVRIGDSIAINGTCLTVEVTRPASCCLVFHTLNETLNRTSLGGLSLGSRVNLERALCFGDRLGGHLVMGHVDTTSVIRRIERTADDYVVTVALPDSLQALVIPKGSIAIDGISLTIADLASDALSVHLIPHTWTHTNLQHAQPGDVVNLEGDMVGKYIVRQQEVGTSSSVTMDHLHQAGFE